MTYNPEVHYRQSIRLRDDDYSRAGAYFVTICAWQRECLFGEVVDGEMPNHIHGIFVLNDEASIVGARHASPDFQVRMVTDRAKDRATHASPLRGPGPKPRSIGAMAGSFKSAVTKHINQLRHTPGVPVWQRNYYERVIRDESELYAIRQYIIDNPLKWAEDENHPTRRPS